MGLEHMIAISSSPGIARLNEAIIEVLGLADSNVVALSYSTEAEGAVVVKVELTLTEGQSDRLGDMIRREG